MRSIISSIPVCSALLLASNFCLADSVTLVSGATLDGELIQESPTDTDVILNTGAKKLAFKRTDVKSISFDTESREELIKLADKTPAGDAAAHFELYKWAKAKRLYSAAEYELKSTLKADPNHAEAKKLLVDVKAEPVAAAAPAENPGSSDESWTIGTRPAPTLFTKGDPRNQYFDKTVGYCKVLAPGATSEEKVIKETVKTLNADRGRYTEMVGYCLDSKTAPETTVRLGALRALDEMKLVSPAVSMGLARLTVADPANGVRMAALESIKRRKDDAAIGSMVKYFVSAYDNNGKILNESVRANSIESIKALSDNRVYKTLLYYATMELRATSTELNNLITRQIDSFQVIPTNPPTILNLSYPIQFPEMKLIKARTTVCAPCAALGDLAGENFGNDVERWGKWIEKLK